MLAQACSPRATLETRAPRSYWEDRPSRSQRVGLALSVPGSTGHLLIGPAAIDLDQRNCLDDPLGFQAVTSFMSSVSSEERDVRHISIFGSLLLAMLVVFGGVDAFAHSHGLINSTGVVESHHEGAFGSTNSDSAEHIVQHCGPSLSCSLYLASDSNFRMPMLPEMAATAVPSQVPPRAITSGPYRPPR